MYISTSELWCVDRLQREMLRGYSMLARWAVG